MTREESIKFLNTFITLGKVDCTEEEVKECMTMSVKALEQQTCEDCVSREEVMQSKPECLNEDVERDTPTQTLIDRTYSKGWNTCLRVFLDNIKQLTSIKPVTQWHKVEDELPFTDVDVLADDGMDMFVAWYDGDDWYSFDENYKRDCPILAWQPLPEPYYEER